MAVEADPHDLAVESEAPSSSGMKRKFAFTTLDGELVTHETVKGRMTVVALVTTYDMASQAQARFLHNVAVRHVPRINALLLVLEPPANRAMVEAFANVLSPSYPVAMADGDTIAGRGAFPGLRHVPSVVLLDREGREVWRSIGLTDDKRLSAVIADHDPRAQ